MSKNSRDRCVRAVVRRYFDAVDEVLVAVRALEQARAALEKVDSARPLELKIVYAKREGEGGHDDG